MSHPQELFFLQECVDWPLHKISMKIDVRVNQTPADWFNQGGIKVEREELGDDGKSFFIQKRYCPKFARFEDAIEYEPREQNDENKETESNYCPTCVWNEKTTSLEIPTVRGQIDIVNSPAEKPR